MGLVVPTNAQALEMLVVTTTYIEDMELVVLTCTRVMELVVITEYTKDMELVVWSIQLLSRFA